MGVPGTLNAVRQIGDSAETASTQPPSPEGDPIGTGTFSTDGSTIKFETDSICSAEGAEQGTYTWTDENDQLTLTKKADQCEFRLGVLDAAVWTQVK